MVTGRYSGTLPPWGCETALEVHRAHNGPTHEGSQLPSSGNPGFLCTGVWYRPVLPRILERTMYQPQTVTQSVVHRGADLWSWHGSRHRTWYVVGLGLVTYVAQRGNINRRTYINQTRAEFRRVRTRAPTRTYTRAHKMRMGEPTSLTRQNRTGSNGSDRCGSGSKTGSAGSNRTSSVTSNAMTAQWRRGPGSRGDIDAGGWRHFLVPIHHASRGAT